MNRVLHLLYIICKITLRSFRINVLGMKNIGKVKSLGCPGVGSGMMHVSQASHQFLQMNALAPFSETSPAPPFLFEETNKMTGTGV